MEAFFTYVEKFVSGLENLGPGSLLIVLLIGLGYIIRISAIRNRFIPLWVIGLGAVLYPFMSPASETASKWEHPTFIAGVYGFIFGIAAWLLHRLAIARLEEWLESKGMFPKSLGPDGSSPKMAIAFLALGLTLATGCAHLQPGEDPLVVRTEQTLTVAGAAFDFVVRMDNANRPFYRTNLPDFHNFANKLRERVPVQNVPGRSNLPLALAIQWNVNEAKRDYIAVKSASSSNALESVRLALQALGNQASAWQIIATNK